jgi:hypothetical protein
MQPHGSEGMAKHRAVSRESCGSLRRRTINIRLMRESGIATPERKRKLTATVERKREPG